MPDSYSYLEAAAKNSDINTWPVGYSKFLRLISVFSHSDTTVTAIQYLVLQSASIAFLLTLLLFIKPNKPVKATLITFFLFNPIPLFLSNYFSADALFIALSLLWFTTLIWVIYRPAFWQIIVQALLLLACFVLRYNAIYYPILSALAFFLSKQNWKLKLLGASLGSLLVFLSYTYTSEKMKSLTGKRQFSPFGGWQIANNALYMYEHIPPNQRRPVPKPFAKLDLMVRQHIDTLQKVHLTHDDSVHSYFYLWSGRGPLVQYWAREWKKDTVTPYFTRWSSEGPLYLNYGMFLIREYPWHFLEHFIVPNAIKFALPPTEFLGSYNMGNDSVGTLAKEWFQYKSQRVKDKKSNSELILFTEW